MRIGITGNRGFIGGHLNNFLSLQENIEIIPFDRDYFTIPEKLNEFVKSCEVIVHLAAINRHSNQDTLYRVNVELVEKLISASNRTKSKPHILFSSSSQEDRNNHYGNSKIEGRRILNKWAEENDCIVTSMIIPNVFGPFGKPFYNSVVSTFCHQLTRGEEPEIISDGILNLIYINDLSKEIYSLIKQKQGGTIRLPHSFKLQVSQLLEKLKYFESVYFKKGIIPSMTDSLDLALFNTYRCYIPKEHYPCNYIKHSDDRGDFVEIAKTETSGQFSFSTTKPGITRGNHFHTRKFERFSVIKGKAKISIRRIDQSDIIDYIIDAVNPAYLDIPIWHTHNIMNIGETELITLFWINEPYKEEDPDTYYLQV